MLQTNIFIFYFNQFYNPFKLNRILQNIWLFLAFEFCSSFQSTIILPFIPLYSTDRQFGMWCGRLCG